MDTIIHQYGNRLRVRVCGFLMQDDKLLLINHKNLGTESFWSPPGGGMEYGESATETLRREFVEETGLEIDVERFICVNEFLKTPLHGVELFFEVKQKSGELMLGSDPEMQHDEQILQEIRFLSQAELREIPDDFLHPVLQHFKQQWGIELQGYTLNGV